MPMFKQALVEHPVDHYDIRENPETRWEQCENGHTQNPEWAEQDCPKCIAEAWLNKELGELKDIHDKLAADPNNRITRSQNTQRVA